MNPLCALIIIDGLGIRSETYGNAVLKAKTPNLDALWSNCPHALLSASGNSVGLPIGYTGNSEVGHLNLGSGQIVYQSLSRIDDSIRIGNFAKIPTLVEAMQVARSRKTRLHLMGILSAGGVHGHIEHLFQLMEICKTWKLDPYIHVILDGQDSGSEDGYLYLSMLNQKIRELKLGHIASMSGRYYAMDRNSRWERTEKAYNAMLGRDGQKSKDPMFALQEAYHAKENDFLFTPTMIVDESQKPIGPIGDNDVVIFYNFREDRARQIIKAFVLDPWPGFKREYIPKNLHFVTMSGYSENLPIKTIFEPHIIKTTVASVISQAGLKQMHIAESEKGAHVTYFFNGGREEPHENEEFFVIPSPKVKNYAEVPAMSAEIIRDEILYRTKMNKYNFVLANFANPDMLGHTGEFDPAVKSVEIVDTCIGDVIKAVIAAGGDFIITSDHGHCDVMIDELTGKPSTAHTLNPVPIILGRGVKEFPKIGSEKIGTGTGVIERGILADVGVTVLSLLGLKQTTDMVGMDLLPVIPGVTK